LSLEEVDVRSGEKFLKEDDDNMLLIFGPKVQAYPIHSLKSIIILIYFYYNIIKLLKN
jgi:hypothetical protein